MKRISIESLRPGDIILTARPGLGSKFIRGMTGGLVSHAMICVEQGSFIDSTMDGVQARNLQREFFENDENVFAFRLKSHLPDHLVSQVVDYARSQIGTRYSLAEAVVLVTGGPRLRTKRLFCSRLVARAYQSVGIQLVPDQDYCSPEDLRISPLLVELELQIETVAQDEIEAMARRPNPIAMSHMVQNQVLDFARSLDASVETFQDLDQVINDHPEWDKRASYANVARVIGAEAGDAGAAEFIRRLVFSALIGNGDMHLKNWSLIYPDRRSAALSPAYDLLSTIPYIEGEDTAALNFSRTKKMAEFDVDELRHLAAKALLPEKLVVATATETVQRFRQVWQSERGHLPLASTVVTAIDGHAPTVPLYSELG
jgi:HipA-like C-terminal domain/Permuted papain-like amidase enzyme, YaeF/YiiX, C92 family